MTLTRSIPSSEIQLESSELRELSSHFILYKQISVVNFVNSVVRTLPSSYITYAHIISYSILIPGTSRKTPSF